MYIQPVHFWLYTMMFSRMVPPTKLVLQSRTIQAAVSSRLSLGLKVTFKTYL